MKIGLMTDSPCDLPQDLVEQYQVQVIPAIVVIDGKPYRDGLDITRTDYYQRLPGLRKSPTTAAPSPADFLVHYQHLLAMGCDHVLGIFTSERLTAIPNIARKAAELLDGNKVTILESGSLSLGIGFQVLAAAEAIENDLPLSEVLAAVYSTRNRLRVLAALDTMEYVRRSGRVPAPVAALGGLLKIKPVVELREGVVRPVSAERTTSHATELLRAKLEALGPLERLAILHTNAEGRARAFLNSLMASPTRLNLPREILFVNVTTVIGTHVGPNGLGFAAVTANLSPK